MRLVCVAVVLSLAVPVWAQRVPQGITYVSASDALNEKAQTALKKMFEKSPPVLSSKGQLLFVGPFLGIKLEKDGRAATAGFTTVKAIIPLGGVNAVMHSFGATRADQYKHLMSLLEKLAPRPPVRVRKLAPEEMKLAPRVGIEDAAEPGRPPSSSSSRLAPLFGAEQR